MYIKTVTNSDVLICNVDMVLSNKMNDHISSLDLKYSSYF